MRDFYLYEAERAHKQARSNTRFGWFYLVMAVLNIAVAVAQLIAGKPPFNLLIALFMVAIWLSNKRTIRQNRESAATYEKLARESTY